MSSPDINRLMDNARVKLPGALDAALQMELFLVMKEFFDSTNIWEEEIPFAVTTTDLSRVTNPEAFTYEIVPTDGQIIRLISITDSGGFPQHGEMAVPGTIVLTYSPNEAGTYTATVSKSISDPVTRQGYPVFPAWVLDRYFDTILSGLLGQMMGQIAKPYSSPQMAQFHMRKFSVGVSRANNEHHHANVMGGQRWRFPQSFTTRRFRRI
jgi:hypothetical protein